MKKGTRILTLALVCIMMMATLAGCGSSKGSGISKLFAGGSANLIEEVGWYNSDVYTLKINADNTYELTYQEHRFGTTDPGIKGLRTIIYKENAAPQHPLTAGRHTLITRWSPLRASSSSSMRRATAVRRSPDIA